MKKNKKTKLKIVKREPETRAVVISEINPQNMNINSLIQLAIEKGSGIDAIGKLMDYQERWEKAEAKKEFFNALAIFQKNPPNIYKDQKVDFDHKNDDGKTKYNYAPLEFSEPAIRKVASPLGLFYRWEPSQVGDKTRITCILSHTRGHSESCFLEAPADMSGKKQPIQGIGSTGSYLQRYTLLMIFGIVAKNMDNDGISVVITPETQFTGFPKLKDCKYAELKILLKKKLSAEQTIGIQEMIGNLCAERIKVMEKEYKIGINDLAIIVEAEAGCPLPMASWEQKEKIVNVIYNKYGKKK